MMDAALPKIIGCDFTSSPTRRKPIVIAVGEWSSPSAKALRLTGIERLESLDAFAHWLKQPAHWVGGFDLPFGLPRELVEQLQWPDDWRACMLHYSQLSRAEIRETFAAFCAERPVGGKFAHRETDIPAGSSPSMKWVNPPVAYMLHAGVPLLLQAGVHLPGLHSGDERRVALEAYPGWLARQLIGRGSYKSDDKAKQTDARATARACLVQWLEQPVALLNGLQLQISAAQREQLVQDASGDSVDAVMCMLEAAWAHARHMAGDSNYGLPPNMDALEGWIVGVQRSASTTDR